MKKLSTRMLTLALVFIMSVSLFAITASAETMYVSGAETGRVYFRVSPGSVQYYALLNNGTPVNSIGRILGSDGVYYNQVVYNGKVGWITSRYLSYSYYTPPVYSLARVSGVNYGVYVWSSAWGSSYVAEALLGEAIYVNWSTLTNGRVYGFRTNGTYGWFTAKYLR